MTAQETNLSNFFETTLNGILASGATSMTLTAAPTSDGTSQIAAPYYLVIDPDNASNREVVEVTAASGTTVSAMTRDKEGRHTTDPTHVDGTVVRMAVIKEMFEDVHDRVDALPTASSTDTLTNKSISGSTNTLTNLPASEVEINNATDGSGIVVDVENDLLLVYDNSATAVKKVKAKQVAVPADVHPFLVMGG